MIYFSIHHENAYTLQQLKTNYAQTPTVNTNVPVVSASGTNKESVKYIEMFFFVGVLINYLFLRPAYDRSQKPTSTNFNI